MSGGSNSYRDLIAWQEAIELVHSVYELTSHFPEAEKFGLTSQMRRAAVSVASNIAEGQGTNSKGEKQCDKVRRLLNGLINSLRDPVVGAGASTGNWKRETRN